MRVLLATCVLFFVLAFVGCQKENDSSDDDSLLSRIRSTWQNFVDQVKDIFGTLRKEIEARTADVRSWTVESWKTFKDSMKNLVNQRPDLTDSQKWEAENYIDTLEMPQKDEKEKTKSP